MCRSARKHFHPPRRPVKLTVLESKSQHSELCVTCLLSFWLATSMSATNEACVPVFCAEGEQHMHVPYVYKEVVGGLLGNRLLDTQRTHTCHVKRMPNPSFVRCSSWPLGFSALLSWVQSVWITWYDGLQTNPQPGISAGFLLFCLPLNSFEIFEFPLTPHPKRKTWCCEHKALVSQGTVSICWITMLDNYFRHYKTKAPWMWTLNLDVFSHLSRR